MVAIDGLPILKTEPWLDSSYGRYVVGGPGAFLTQIEDCPRHRRMHQQLLNESDRSEGDTPA